MARAYLVDDAGGLELVDLAIIDGVPHTNAGSPLTRTERTRTLMGWPDTIVRDWETDAGYVFLVPDQS